MAVNSVLQTGVQGVQSSVRGIQDAAQKISQTGTPQGPQTATDIVEPLVDLKLYEVSAQANAKVVQTADRMLGTLLDTTA